MSDNRYHSLEQTIAYTFTNKMLLDTAFTHKSYANEVLTQKKESYERFEFLGDAILEYIVSEYLFENYKDLPEGKLTKLRASLVCEFTLSKISRELSFGDYGYFSKGETQTGGKNRDSILCDMFESVLGAIYLDGGMEPAKAFVYKFLLTDIAHKQLFYDSKSNLQEYAQKHNKQLTYDLLEEKGPEHDKLFCVQVRMGEAVLAAGEGHSRKSAEQMAAYKALCDMKQ